MDDERNEDDVAKLLGFAGRRPGLPEDKIFPAREAAREVFRRRLQRPARLRRAAWTAAGVTAAGVAAALVIAAGLWRGSLRPAPALPVAAFEMRSAEVTLTGAADLTTGAVIATGPDGRAALRLAEGGPALRLAGGSVLRLDSARRVTLSAGAVYIDSAAGGGLEIATPLGTVFDVGTQFEAQLVADSLRVRVREGKVRVEHRAASHEAEAGGELVLHPDGSARHAAIAVYGPGWDWIQRAAPPFAIEGATLAAFLDWASRETGLRWQLAGSGRSPDEIVLHGSIEGLTADEALAVVLPGCGYRARREGDVLWLDELR